MNKEFLREKIRQEIEIRKKLYPFKNFKLNKGQARGLSCWDYPDARTGNYVKYNIIMGGNGSGKTTLIPGEVLPALCYGIDAISPDCPRRGIYQLLLARKELRADKQLLLRITAPSKSLGRDGAIVKRIQQWIPQAKFSDFRDFYHSLEINGQKISLMSSNQPATQHSGDDLDLAIVDEPLSNEVFAETIGRLRNGGFLLHTVTPLGGCDYIEDMNDSEYASVTAISLWDNCKDIEGTNGVLAKSDIEAMIDAWKNIPEELDARVYGKMTKLSGKMFPEFDEKVHIVDSFPAGNYVYGYAIDPHLVKEPYVLFWAQDTLGNIYVYDEYPNVQWNLITTTRKSIEDVCFELKRKIGNKKFAYTLGDPNLMNMKLPNSRLTIAQEYRNCGVDVNARVEDNTIIGRSEIHKLLRYDDKYEISSMNCPRLYFTRNCKSAILAMKKHRHKDKANQVERLSSTSSTTEESEWKCIIDCLRYMATAIKPFHTVQNEIAQQEWEEQSFKQDYSDVGNVW